MEISLEKFVEEVTNGNHEELKQIRDFQELIKQLVREENEVYCVSVTSNL